MPAGKKVAKKVVKKKPAPRQKGLSRPASPRKKAATAGKKRPAPRAKAPARRKPAGLGRVKISSDARLDLVFQKDYQAREIFDFLRVQTIRELEQFPPQEIIERLTGPMTQTVLRIRKTLALANRHLAKDEKFARDFLAEFKKAL